MNTSIRERSSAASSSVPSSKASTARRTTSPAETPRARALASSEAAPPGTSESSIAPMPPWHILYAYICINIGCSAPLSQASSPFCVLGSTCFRYLDGNTKFLCSRCHSAIERHQCCVKTTGNREVKRIRCSQTQIEASHICIGQPRIGGMHIRCGTRRCAPCVKIR